MTTDLTREERRSLHLHRAIAGRLEQDPAAVLARARETLRVMRDRNPFAEPLLAEWEALLVRPVDEIAAVLADPSERARELRHMTPFAGVLSARERAEVYRSFAWEEARR